MAEHTNLPWEKAGVAYSEQSRVCGPRGENNYFFVACLSGPDHAANAAFIVKACNAHEALVEAVKEADLTLCAHGISAGSHTRKLLAEALALSSADRITVGGEK